MHKEEFYANQNGVFERFFKKLSNENTLIVCLE
jgi:hypothetical protein